MSAFSRLGRFPFLAAVSGLLIVGPARGEDAPKFDKVTFDTFDGVKLAGSFWPAKEGKKSPVVLILHDFKHGKGGDSHQNGLDNLGAALNKEGYAVLSFDFRGHGASTGITDVKAFWTVPQNRSQIPVKGFNPTKPPESISASQFLGSYYPVLANDITAARAFIDRKNDDGELNSSRLIVIGAGEGATLGLLWLTSEFHRYRGLPQAQLGKPTGEDVTAAVWLNLSNSIGGRPMPVKSWLTEVGRQRKVPTAFVFGKDDKDANLHAYSFMRTVVPGYERDEKGKAKTIKDDSYALMGEHAEETNLSGSQLLQKALGTEGWIVNSYLKAVLDKKGAGEWVSRDWRKSPSFWFWPPRVIVEAKGTGEDASAMRAIPLIKLGVQ